MSFGFGVGDFLAVGNLCLQLHRSFKGVPGTFDEISGELSSLHIVLNELKEQASNPSHFSIEEELTGGMSCYKCATISKKR
jgi:hypothetical protein